MQHTSETLGRRILLIDDSSAIHDDFRKVLQRASGNAAELANVEAAVFGSVPERVATGRTPFQIDSALQGKKGVELVRQSLQDKRPYALAFVDVRMPPGWDGIETVKRIWELDPDVQIVLCTAHSDYSWEQTVHLLGHPDRFFILKKPFDPIEVLQLAEGLTEKWRLGRQEKRHLEDQRRRFEDERHRSEDLEHRLADLDRKIRERSEDLQAFRSINAQLDAANRTLTAAGERSDSKVKETCSLERDMRRALLAREFRVWYQPLVEIASRRIVSLEALVRWAHPEHGMISPAKFIPIAESTGLIVPLGEYVLRTVCEQVVSWQREQVPVVRVAVNVSSIQLERRPIHELVRSVLRETGMQPHQLALELTESALLNDLENQCRYLQELRNDGVEIEVDDFGTGYSNLAHLKHLPVDALKIDRSLIEELASNSSDNAIVVAILALARTLGLRVIAEGVERPDQLQVLVRHGCEFAQGFYFSHPLPPDSCRDLLCEVAERQSFSDTLRLRIAASRKRE